MDEARALLCQKACKELDARAEKRRLAVGMKGFVRSPESDEALQRMHEIEKKPHYEGKHRDIVRLAIKAGLPVPPSTIAGYVDEP
jgi:hypothetical protein